MFMDIRTSLKQARGEQKDKWTYITRTTTHKNNNKQEIMCSYTKNREHEMYDCTGNNWSHRNSNKRLKEKFGSRTGRTFGRCSTKDGCTWNITHNTESAAE
jgi:hypothetical protein